MATSQSIIYENSTFVPTVTLVGGAGNTTPVYSTNTGNYTKLQNKIFVDIFVNGDGGDEGAGTGVLNIAIPYASSASFPGGYFKCGYAVNGTTKYLIYGKINAGESTIALRYFSSASADADFTGAVQNNATRTIRLQFSYTV